MLRPIPHRIIPIHTRPKLHLTVRIPIIHTPIPDIHRFQLKPAKMALLLLRTKRQRRKQRIPSLLIHRPAIHLIILLLHIKQQAVIHRVARIAALPFREPQPMVVQAIPFRVPVIQRVGIPAQVPHIAHRVAVAVFRVVHHAAHLQEYLVGRALVRDGDGFGRVACAVLADA